MGTRPRQLLSSQSETKEIARDRVWRAGVMSHCISPIVPEWSFRLERVIMIKCYGYYRRLLRMVLLRCDHPIDGYFCSTTYDSIYRCKLFTIKKWVILVFDSQSQVYNLAVLHGLPSENWEYITSIVMKPVAAPQSRCAMGCHGTTVSCHGTTVSSHGQCGSTVWLREILVHKRK